VNQNTNLIQWKNLTEEQKADFDFENYKYVMQYSHETVWTNPRTPVIEPGKNPNAVYRLVIEDDKWYTCVSEDAVETIKGSEFSNPDKAICLRPARKDEIPKSEKTLQERIQEEWPDKEVVMLEWEYKGRILQINRFNCYHWHTSAQSMKGFKGYIYDDEELLSISGDDDFLLTINPLEELGDGSAPIHPVAVLFEAKK